MSYYVTALSSREERVQRSIEDLTARDCELLRVYLAGHSLKVMGGMLGISSGGVGAGLARIRLKYEERGLRQVRRSARKRAAVVVIESEVKA